jgi:hypothetical protein
MKCYFCQNAIYDIDQNGFFDCEACAKKITTGKGQVIHVTDGQGLLFVHIYIDRRTICRLGGSVFGSTSYVEGCSYHFRLHVRENYTNLGIPTDSDVNDICKITGFPINPDNAEEKLKLYLLFS